MSITITKIKLGEFFPYDGSWNPRGDDAGGFDICIWFKNDSNKTIKYITFIVTAYNRVGDPAICEVNNTATKRLKFVGPVESQEITNGIWNTAWYNYTLSTAKIEKIEIEYMDGSTEEQTTGLEVNPQSGKKRPWWQF